MEGRVWEQVCGEAAMRMKWGRKKDPENDIRKTQVLKRFARSNAVCSAVDRSGSMRQRSQSTHGLGNLT